MSRPATIAAWSVHIFTTTGVLFAFLTLVAMWNEQPDLALWLLAAAVVVDSIDGTFARKARVTEHTPRFDGATLDNLIDYLTWAFLPLFWAYVFLDAHLFVCIFAAMASSIGFSLRDAKTEDHYFLGFPSYWNLVVLYLYLLPVSALWISIILTVLGVMVFIPIKWIYPSRTKELRKTSLLLSSIYFGLVLYLLIRLEDAPMWMVVLSLFYPIYYVSASLYYGNLGKNFNENISD